MFLDGVATGFVEGIHQIEVIPNLCRSQRMEAHVRPFGKNALAMLSKLQEANSGDHGVNLSLKFTQHAFGFSPGGWFAEQFRSAIEIHQGVGADDDGIGKLLRHGAGFAVGVDLRHFPSRQLFVMNFVSGTGDDLKVGYDLAEQFHPAGGGRCQNESVRFHTSERAGGSVAESPRETNILVFPRPGREYPPSNLHA
jgi:hypothetical protein